MVEDTSTETEVELIEEESDAASGMGEDEFVKLLAGLYKQLKFAKNLTKAMKEVEGYILEMMGCNVHHFSKCR